MLKIRFTHKNIYDKIVYAIKVIKIFFLFGRKMRIKKPRMIIKYKLLEQK
ncbi:hypothetical protein M2092_000001 [Fusobacterium sp. PH5-44]